MKKYRLFTLMIVIHLFSITPAAALDLNAFGDVTFGDSSETGEVSGFSIGQLDFWATQNLDQAGRFKTFLELVVESPGEGFIIDLERLWVEYHALPPLRIRGGRFHTSLGHWNRTHHHGAHMQTTVFRPLFLDFEDGETAVLPIHIVGLMGVVDHEIGAGHVHFEIQVGNGSSFEKDGEINPNTAGDVDQDKGGGARLLFSPGFLEGLGIGLSFNTNKITLTEQGKPNKPLVDQRIYAADLTFIDKFETDIEFIFEYYWIVNDDPNGGSETSTAWYVQGAKTFRDFVTPYVRYESFTDLKMDPYFAALGTTEYKALVYGTRLDFDIVAGAATSIKLEGRNKDEPVIGSSNSYWLQWTFGF